MRICLVAHGFPPNERTGVENYTAALAAAHARAGDQVEVFVPRRDPSLPHLSLRREVRGLEQGGHGWGLNWVNDLGHPSNPAEMLDPPGIANCFGAFLDRERPEVVHFQHVIKLGAGLLEETRSRGIPIVYTAHDYYSVCHRFTLLKPNLGLCEGPGDPERCTRCDLALGRLNRETELGDYQQGAFPEQLPESAAVELAAILAGDEPGSGLAASEWTRARGLRASLDARRAAAFGAVDLLVAPTHFLAERLAEGGFSAPASLHVPYGIETAELLPLRRAGARELGRGELGRPVRFGYLGGLSKHKGVHVLVEAFARLKEPAELVVYGDSSDKVYVAHVRARAEEAGARWAGPFRREELARCLEEIDVVVVPSIWVENYPFVIREALAAGRPVVTSDLGALAESVEHGVDGLRVPPGDVDALAEALGRFAREPELLPSLVAGIGPVRELADEAAELRRAYEELARKRAESPRELPSHLAEAWREWHVLDGKPSRELLADVFGGLEALRGRLSGGAVSGPGVEASPEALLARGLARHSRARVELRDLKLERHWLRESLEGRERAERALDERLAWREVQLATEERERGWLRERLANVEEERDWLRENQAGLEREKEWLRGTLAEREEELVWRRETVERLAEIEAYNTQLEARSAELEAHSAELEAHSAELEVALAESNAEFEAEVVGFRTEEQGLRARMRQAAEVGLVALQAQEKVLGAELQPLFDALERAVATPAPESAAGERVQGAAVPATLEELAASIRRGIRRLRDVQDELAWRRREMEGAMEQFQRPLARALLKRTGLGGRIALWLEGSLSEPDTDSRSAAPPNAANSPGSIGRTSSPGTPPDSTAGAAAPRETDA